MGALSQIIAKPLMMSRCCTRLRQRASQSDGFALPMAMVLGMITVTIVLASVIGAQSSRDSSQTRQASGASAIVTDSAIAHAMVELAKPQNGSLLVRNYDPINPATGKNYLGLDGLINSGDETGTKLDEWTGYDPSQRSCYQEKGWSAPTMNLSGSIGSKGDYQLLAYRYDPSTEEGKALVEGRYQGIRSYVLLTISIRSVLDDFPGIGLIDPSADDGYPAGVLALRGREIRGNKANVFMIPTSSADPSTTGRSVPSDPDRSSYLNAVWSSNSDGATTDTISGSVIACNLNINIPQGITGTNLGVINSSTTLSGVGNTTPTNYQLEGIHLSGTETLRIDTTGGPVVLNMINTGVSGEALISLRDTAKILNVRTDGQPPKVGDVRIMIRSNQHVVLYDQSCIQQAFLYSWTDELLLLTDGPGCPSGQNTNFEGVVWVEAILSSKNDGSNRNVAYLGYLNQIYDTTVTPGATSGISVPDDVASLQDLLQYTEFPVTYRYGEIKNWQRVRL